VDLSYPQLVAQHVVSYDNRSKRVELGSFSARCLGDYEAWRWRKRAVRHSWINNLTAAPLGLDSTRLGVPTSVVERSVWFVRRLRLDAASRDCGAADALSSGVPNIAPSSDRTFWAELSLEISNMPTCSCWIELSAVMRTDIENATMRRRQLLFISNDDTMSKVTRAY